MVFAQGMEPPDKEPAIISELNSFTTESVYLDTLSTVASVSPLATGALLLTLSKRFMLSFRTAGRFGQARR